MKTPSRLAYKGRVLLDSPNPTPAEREAAGVAFEALVEADLLAAAPRDSVAGRRALERFAKLVAEGKQPSQDLLRYMATVARAVLNVTKGDKVNAYRKALGLSAGRRGRQRAPKNRDMELADAVNKALDATDKRWKQITPTLLVTSGPRARGAVSAALEAVAKKHGLSVKTVRNARERYLAALKAGLKGI